MITKTSYQIKPFRADSLYKFLTKFDYIDNNLLFYSSYQFNSLNLNKIFIQTEANFSFSKLNLLMVGITIEVLGQQRILIKTLDKKSFTKVLYLKSTLRKTKLFTFLDICLVSLFLNHFSSLTMNFNYAKINQKSHVYFQKKFVEKLNSYANLQYSIQVFNCINQNQKLNSLSTQ